MNKKDFIVIVIIGLIIGLIIFFVATPNGIIRCNNYKHSLHKANDVSLYETKKEVENTCRSMIASYTADKNIYILYIISESEEEQKWAKEAMIRANRTAATYNEYILKNNYVFDNNIPNDIYRELQYLQ